MLLFCFEFAKNVTVILFVLFVLFCFVLFFVYFFLSFLSFISCVLGWGVEELVAGKGMRGGG